MDGRTAVILLNADAFAIGYDRILAEPLLYGLVQNDVQPAAMDADFGKGISGEFPALLAVDELSETVEETAVLVFDAGLKQFTAKAERAELTHRMRQQRDADAERLDLRRALVYAAGDSTLLEIKCEREPANATADNRYVHPVTPVRWLVSYSGLISTLRILIAPAPCCRAIGPSSNMPLRSFAVVCPLSTTVMSRPLAVTSYVFHLPAAFGIGSTSTYRVIAPVP